MKKILALSLTGFIFSSTQIFAAIEKPKLVYTQTYRYNNRKSEHSLIYRPELIFESFKENLDIKIIPFAEARWNAKKDIWERDELGIEFGKDIFKWFYIGEDIHNTWRRKEAHATELESRIKLHHKLCSILKRELVGYFLNEFTFTLKENRGICNEIITGLNIALFKYLSLDVDWRHIDWLHEPDSDNFEAGFKISF